MSLRSTPPRDDEEEELYGSDSDDDVCLNIEDWIRPRSITVCGPEQLDSYWMWFPESHLQILSEQEKKLEKWIEDLDEDLMLQFPIKVTQLMVSGFYASLRGNFLSAQDTFDDVEKLIQTELDTGANPLEMEAYSYLLNANRLMNLKASGREMQAKTLFEKTISMDLDPAKTKAALLAMKSIFIGHAGQNQNKLSLFRRVVELDPNNLDWMHFHYRGVRSVRRERNFISTPSDEEAEVCHRAYEINNNAPATVFDMATLFDDIMKAHFANKLEHKLIENMGLLNFIKQLIYFSKRSCELNPRSIRANIRLANVLSTQALHRRLTTFSECENQFLKCLRNWPTSSEVLHKIGKFYVRSRRPGGLEKGVMFLKRGLESNWNNFPCLMDYLRARIKLETPLDELIKIVHEMVPLFRFKNVYQGKLFHLQASFYWHKGNTDKATKLWVTAFDTDPTCLVEDSLWELMTSERVFCRNYMSGRKVFNAVRNGIRDLLSSQRRHKLKAEVMKALHNNYEAYLVSQNPRGKSWSGNNMEGQEANGSQLADFSTDPGFYKKEHFVDLSDKWMGVRLYGGGYSLRTASTTWADPNSEDDRTSVASSSSHFTFDSETIKLLGFGSGPSGTTSTSSESTISSRSTSIASGSSYRSWSAYPMAAPGKSNKNFDTDDNWRSN